MMSRNSSLIVAAALALSAVALPAQDVDVHPAQRRAAALEAARELTERKQPPALPDELRNPFTSVVSNRPDASAPAAATRQAPARLSDRQLLEQIAPLVNPTGLVRLGGEPILLFGQKRIKVGDSLPIVFDGSPYILVISGIESTSFTLRLNGEEITRPIQPAK